MIQQRLRVAGQFAPSIKVLDGPIPTTLGAYAAAIDADLVVMTTHGRGGLARFWLGSVADSFVRHSHVPVLLIHPNEATDGPVQIPHIPPRKICVALDGSPYAEQVLGRALALDTRGTAEYLFVQVVDAMIIASAPFTPELLQQDLSLTAERQKEAQRYLEKLAAPFRAQGHRIQTHVVIDPQPALAILRAARAHKIDVIALATHGRGGVRRLLLGSVADKVVRATDRPILLYRPQFTAEHEYEAMEEQDLVAEHAL